MVIDYRKINEATIQENFPLPKIQEIIYKLKVD